MFTKIIIYSVTLIILHNLFKVDGKSIQTGPERREQRLENGTKECTQMGLYCDSCTDVVMCIETDFGWKEQHVETCNPTETCLKGKCTSEENIICDGTTKIPFQCHVSGAFPDPFDCQSYHLCVLDTSNSKPTLRDFKHSCGPYYRYDSKSTYCKYKIEENSCPSLPVPVCLSPGHSEALEENDSIFFICEEIQGVLYPHLYVCPHGEQYDAFSRTCMEFVPTTTTEKLWVTTGYPWETTTDYWETTRW